MWIFVWIALSPAGVVTSGSIEFPTREACEAGKVSWGDMRAKTFASDHAPSSLQSGCVEKATGKP